MAAKLWWIVHKDLLAEWRERQVLPAMLLVGAVVCFIFGFQLSLVPAATERMIGGLYWLTVYLVSVIALEGSFAAEREANCWHGLRLYPVTPPTIYLAKYLANLVSLAVLQLCLLPLFALIMRVPLWDHPGHLLLITLVGNLALTSIGTLVAALVAAAQRGRGLLLLLVLPLEIPVILAASEATRLMMEHQTDAQWWRWMQLLVVFTVVFVTAGVVLFEFILEE